jgi:hypothetical protein
LMSSSGVPSTTLTSSMTSSQPFTAMSCTIERLIAFGRRGTCVAKTPCGTVSRNVHRANSPANGGGGRSGRSGKNRRGRGGRTARSGINSLDIICIAKVCTQE